MRISTVTTALSAALVCDVLLPTATRAQQIIRDRSPHALTPEDAKSGLQQKAEAAPILNPFTAAPTPSPKSANPFQDLLPFPFPNLDFNLPDFGFGGIGGGGGGGGSDQPQEPEPQPQPEELNEPELEQPELEQPELEQPELEQPELEQPDESSPTANLYCVRSRYFPWSQLEEVEQKVLSVELGYTEDTWNVEASNPIERLKFADLTPTQQEAFVWLGYTEDTYDCFVNHFEGYSWEELESKGVVKNFEEMGWDQYSWDNYLEPESGSAFASNWRDLKEFEQMAAYKLCFFEDSWDRYELTEYLWTDGEPGLDCATE